MMEETANGSILAGKKEKMELGILQLEFLDATVETDVSLGIGYSLTD